MKVRGIFIVDMSVSLIDRRNPERNTSSFEIVRADAVCENQTHNDPVVC